MAPTSHDQHYSLSWLAWLAAGLPLLTIHLSFFTSVAEGIFAACNPYWIDCTSISHGGRHGSAYFIFKAGMLPTAVLLAFFWVIQAGWLAWLTNKRHSALVFLGVVASIALIIYTLFLGHAGDEFRLLRRFGVVLFMSCTFICQVLSAQALWRSDNFQRQGRQLIISCGVIISVAIFSLLLDATLGDDYNRLEDAFEWWLMMALIGNQLYLASRWQASRLRITLGSQ